MRCRECGVEMAVERLFCGRCGTPAVTQPSVPADSAAHEAGAGLEEIGWRAATESSSAGRGRLRITAAITAFAGAALIIWACTLPVVLDRGFRPGSMSLFSYGYSNAQIASLEPVVVAILAVAGAVLLIAARRGPRRRWLATGILLASGTQTLMLFVGYQAGDFPPTRPGSAPAVGMVGAGALIVAGMLGAFGPLDVDVHASVRRTLRYLACVASLAVIAGASAALVGAANVPPDDRGWQYPVYGAVFWAGFAVLCWGIVLWVRRSAFLKLLRRDEQYPATVTAYRPRWRTLTLDAPYDGYLPEFKIHLAWWPKPVAPQVGERVTFCGPGNGIGALLVAGSDRGWTVLATGWSRQPMAAAPQPTQRVNGD